MLILYLELTQPLYLLTLICADVMIKALFLSLICSACLSTALAQNQHVVSGIVVLHPTPHLRGLDLPVKNVIVRNRDNGSHTSPNSIGYFEISAKIGDYLEASIKGLPSQTLLVTKYDNIVFDMDSTIHLQEVAIIGIKENEKGYETLKKTYSHKNSLHFNGKPPVTLLSPMGGSPATFFYERFSREGKNARKRDAYILAEAAQHEVQTHFNEELVKEVIPEITDDEVKSYMDLYTPEIKQLRKWSAYELIKYIKTTHKLFKADCK